MHAHDGNPSAVAQHLIDDGLYPVPVARGQKGPKGKDALEWGEKTYAPSDFSPDANIGAHHVNIAAVDRDCPETYALRDRFLPKTRRSGRQSNPESHSWYYVDGEPEFLQLKDGEMLIELRYGRGKQTLVPPSIHPEGEPYVTFNPEAPIARISAEELERGVRLEAATAIIARHYPPPGGQYDFGLHLAGFLLRNGLDEDAVFELMMAAKELQPEGVDRDAEKNIRGVVATTAQKLADEEEVTGGTRLKEEYDEKLPRRLATALGWKKPDMGGGKRKAAADDLVRMGIDMAEELFTDQYKQPYALVNGASLPLDALGDRLAVEWFRARNKAVQQDSIRTALNTLAALARVEGTEHDLKTRWGRVGKTIYYETAPGTVWEIDAAGWRRAADPPVRFRRLDLLRPLPDPVEGGTLKDLTEVVKLEGVGLRMYLSAMVSYPFEDVPRPALAIVGRQGGGKSTRTKVLKRLMDEDGSDFVSPQGDILRQATHRAIVAFDNQSSFPKDFSDLLSSLITGGGDSRRELYSNNREFAFKVMRPVVLNGINVPSDRPDLLERTLVVEVPDIRPEERETEHEFWTKFEDRRGLLLGVVFDLISGVLRNLRPLQRRPRMADWSDYASALYAHIGWGREQFQEDWAAEEDRQHETALEGILGAALLDHFKESFDPEARWKTPVEVLKQTPQKLFKDTRTHVDLDATRFFPKSVSSFMRELNRLVPALQHAGYGIKQGTRGKGKDSRKVVEVWCVQDPSGGPSPDGSAGRSVGSVGSLSDDGTMQGYKNDPGNGLPMGNSSAQPEGSVGSVGSVGVFEKERGNKTGASKKRRRRSNSLKAQKMPTDPADPSAVGRESPANAQKSGLSASADNAGRHVADPDKVPADRHPPDWSYVDELTQADIDHLTWLEDGMRFSDWRRQLGAAWSSFAPRQLEERGLVERVGEEYFLTTEGELAPSIWMEQQKDD